MAVRTAPARAASEGFGAETASAATSAPTTARAAPAGRRPATSPNIAAPVIITSEGELHHQARLGHRLPGHRSGERPRLHHAGLVRLLGGDVAAEVAFLEHRHI